MSSPDADAAARLLSSDWLDGWSAAVATAGVTHEGPPATIEIRVTGGPEDAVTWHVVLATGSAPRYVRGARPDADASYDQGWDDIVAQLNGDFDPVVAFMQGGLKVKGATRPLYELFRLWADPAHQSATAALATAF